jgi:hypothetical protein
VWGNGKHSGAGQSPGLPGPDRCQPNGLRHSAVGMTNHGSPKVELARSTASRCMTVSGQLDIDSIGLFIRSESQRIEGVQNWISIAELPSVERKSNENGHLNFER